MCGKVGHHVVVECPACGDPRSYCGIYRRRALGNPSRHHENSGSDIADHPIDPLRKPFPGDRAAADDAPVPVGELLGFEAERLGDLRCSERAREVLLVGENQQGCSCQFLRVCATAVPRCGR